ncbi:MAG: aspartate--tRNA(Asn) ligase [archaeon]
MEIIHAKAGDDVKLQGWVHNYRDLGGLKFLQLRDSSGIIQLTVVKGKAPDEVIDSLQGLTKESVIAVEGAVQECPKSDSGLELLPRSITVIVRANPELPISPAERSGNVKQTVRLDWRSLDLRRPAQQAVFRIQSAMLNGMRQYLLDNGFIQVFTPCIMGVASESGSEVFPIIYFNREAFLRQDPQLHRQLTIASGFPRVFDIGPAWRAEQSHTTKHLCEHRVCAVELAFIKDEQDTMRVQEGMMVAALSMVKENCKAELKVLGVEIIVPKTPFPELRFPELYSILAEKGKTLAEGEDIDSEAEKILWEHVKEKYGSEFYFINRFPSKIKPFYVMKVDEDPIWARSVDMYFKGLELSSGGQREHRYEKIVEAVKEKGMKESDISWFSRPFQFGVPPHGGFAIGIERLTQSMLNIENVRDCVLFPRDPERLIP